MCEIGILKKSTYTLFGNSLPALGADPRYTTISGFSGGAYVANDLKVIYSDTFKGAALLSGGPYNTAAYKSMAELNSDILPDSDFLA